MPKKIKQLFIFIFFSHSTYALDCNNFYEPGFLDYHNLICLGDKEFRKKHYNKALDKYNKASKINLFESPNFLVYYKIAEALCATKDFKNCSTTLENFETMLDIYEEKIPCPEPNTPNADTKVPSKKVVSVMCYELIYKSYAQPNKDAQNKITQFTKKYREEIARIKKHYNL
ncbi:MAG: hypothetical protein ACK5NY_08890 [Burkholderiaceae bacterium]|jgi:hypothetical protein